MRVRFWPESEPAETREQGSTPAIPPHGINHERHLCQVMAEADAEASLKKFLLDAEKRYDGFKDPNGKTKD